MQLVELVIYLRSPRFSLSSPLVIFAVDGFLDFEDALAVPPLVNDVCGIASGTFDPGRIEGATLAITSDDELRIYVNGAAVYEQSPFRHPARSISPSGDPLPGGPISRPTNRSPPELLGV